MMMNELNRTDAMSLAASREYYRQQRAEDARRWNRLARSIGRRVAGWGIAILLFGAAACAAVHFLG
jgi:GAF domain-containing protein